MPNNNDRKPAQQLWLSPPPPFPKETYSPDKALRGDIDGITYALHVFLDSYMHESEDFCRKYDPKMERLYVATGFAIIQFLKGLMSFADEDLVEALTHVRHGNNIANQHRKRAASLPTRLAGLVVGALSTSGVSFMKSMTTMQRHAELVYAESLFEKVSSMLFVQPRHTSRPRVRGEERGPATDRTTVTNLLLPYLSLLTDTRYGFTFITAQAAVRISAVCEILIPTYSSLSVSCGTGRIVGAEALVVPRLRTDHKGLFSPVKRVQQRHSCFMVHPAAVIELRVTQSSRESTYSKME